ncbi:hypothetical protein PP504_gp74 [Gordonia phage Dolores]|uniref:Uncharacterized protein n=3 Tax=Beenievirus TaxID=3044673 RepID=A0A514DIH2_9CAUD|nr:hypothetical protein PP503_gp73 [Gordonia phage Sekhmet]YP_010654241.1 hypothetical protein PP504_gp74 [Gordonia phage Dolores]YP_010654776.1 hypothetical protein PP511_gp67 [Gordonia phage Suerte]URM87968.1 hypothetical protein SEA_WINKNICK_74 [Gordonia phage WinkNick]QDH93411.1 hypothetical protein SEA_SEKHMET_73 [Gordonia phage Sekhmet]QFP97038.1 hypothetical protein SEA_SUERTE_67 [Gordonia phage Suerte]UAJ16504.1 hypothetical protein SEA_DOLORES_74 [Gordonia phage Dolores]
MTEHIAIPAGRHRLEDGGRTVADTIARITSYDQLVRMLTWPNPFLAPTLPSRAPGDTKALRQLRNHLTPEGHRPQ